MNLRARQIVAIIVVFFAVSAIAWCVFGGREAQFSAKEEALQQALEPNLESLLIAEEDLSGLTREFYDCTGEITSGLDYDFRLDRDGDSGEFKDAEIVDSEYSRIANSDYCAVDDDAWVASIVWLAPTKESILYYTRVHADLAVHDERDLAKLVNAEIEGYYSGTDWSSPAWIDVPTLGTNGYAFKYTLHYPDYADRVVHDFVFMRGVVYATLTVGLPETAGSERRAIEIARALDDKIKDQIRALAAEVQTR